MDETENTNNYSDYINSLFDKYLKDIIGEGKRKPSIEVLVKIMEMDIKLLQSENKILKNQFEMMERECTNMKIENYRLQETVTEHHHLIKSFYEEENSYNVILPTNQISDEKENDKMVLSRHEKNKEEKENDNTVFPEPEINEEAMNDAAATSAEFTAMFNEFVSAECIVRSDVYESSVQLEGRFRLWRQTKPKKEIFHAFKSYMDTRFQPKRMPINKQNAHCYVGIKLRETEYKKKFSSSDAQPVETFLFQMCKFSDTGKILNSVLLREYKKWKQSVHRECAPDEVELKELKGYLNACPYALKATVWTEHGVNEGYYGLSLLEDYIKQTEQIQKSNKNTTGKVVEKREIKTNALIGTWDSIADAAISENVCAAKMSRYIRDKKQIGDYCYIIKC